MLSLKLSLVSFHTSSNVVILCFINTYRLIAECQESQDNKLPEKFTHLIIVPSTDIKWIEKHEEWVVEKRNQNGKFVVDPDGCIAAGSGKSSYNHQCLKKLLLDFPIYYRSWEELEESFKDAISKFRDEKNHSHWERLCEELSILTATAGRYK